MIDVDVEPRLPKLLSLPSVMELTTLSRPSIYRLIATKQLQPIKLGKKVTFLESQVIDWINAKVQSSQAA